MNEEYRVHHTTYNNILYFFYKLNSRSIASLLYSYGNWYIEDYINEITIKIKDVVSFSGSITEEEYFQLSLVWNYNFPLESVYKIINYVYNKRQYDFTEYIRPGLIDINELKVKNV